MSVPSKVTSPLSVTWAPFGISYTQSWRMIAPGICTHPGWASSDTESALCANVSFCEPATIIEAKAMQMIERFIEFSLGEVGMFIASQLDMRERTLKLLM